VKSHKIRTVITLGGKYITAQIILSLDTVTGMHTHASFPNNQDESKLKQYFKKRKHVGTCQITENAHST